MSRQQTCFVFVATEPLSFVATKMTLVAGPANDTEEVLSVTEIPRGDRGKRLFLKDDFCIQMGSDVSIFKIKCCINCEGTVVHKEQLLKSKESRSRIEPRSLCLPA